MTQYVIRRILLMIPTLFGISFVVWLVMALSPGRPGLLRLVRLPA